MVEALEQRLAPANVPILSGHYDASLSGWNNQETVLNPTNVNAENFGNLYNYAVDGYTYAQPLYVPNLTVGSAAHNVVFAATEHDSVYAFDADGGGQLWKRSFINPAGGVTTVPQPDVISGDVVPEIGITGTPVIDPSSNTMFVVVKTKEMVAGTAHYLQRLHALDITTGLDRATNGVVTIGDTTLGGPDEGYTDTTSVAVPGTGVGSDGTTLRFNALRENQRSALALVNGVVYLAWASHGDNGPYHGWVVGYKASDLSLQKVFNTSPNGNASGIWESGGGLGADAAGNLYFATGNGFPQGGQNGFALGGPVSLGSGGGGLGYQGINQSAAVTFRAYDHSSTGLATDGSFTGPNFDLGGSTGIDFNAAAQDSSPHVFQVTLSYGGTTLSETIKDLNTSATVTESYSVNLQALVGGNTAFVGFTGGTGGLNVQQDIQSWTYAPGSGTGIDHATGFASNSDLQANGAASFSGTVARITPAANGQAGSVFSKNQVDVSNFTTTFTFKMSAGTNPIADGLSFTVQNNASSYSESVLKLSSTGQLSVADYFTPTDWQTLDSNDADLGSGGTMLLPDSVGSAAHPHLIIETGKTGRLYLIDRDNMGKNNTPNADQNLQTVTLGGPGVWGNAAFFLDNPGSGAPGTGSGLIYYWGTSAPAEAFRITNGVIDPTPVTQTNFAIGFPGAQPSISSSGSTGTSAIMWAMRVDNYGQKGPAELMAFNAEDLSQEIYSSNATGQRDQFGSSVKFTFPIVSNGHVYAGSNGFLSVFGLFPTPAAAPAAPSGLTGTAVQGGTQLQLSWANNYTSASPATANEIFRSPDGVMFQQIATVSRTATTFTDSGLNPATLYYYRVVATNQKGDSAPSNTAAVRTRIAAPILTVADVCPGAVDLSWTGVANNHYDVKRSADGVTFTTIATVPASQTAFMDTGLANGTYFYQVTAASTFPEGTDTGDSNVVKATIGPININHFVSAGNPGFTDSSDMQANGSAQFTTENLLRLNNNFGQAGSAFETQRVGIRGFTTSFQVRLHEGTQPNPADGFTFLIQADSPSSLGGGGGSLGYQGIPNSVAIKFDVYDNEGESTNSTGLFFDGGFPGLPHNPGEVNIALNAGNVNLRSQSTKTITLTYDGTTLTETIHDPDPGLSNGGNFTTTYTVDIAGIVGADTAFVGFTGGTGGLFSLQDVLNWKYSEQETNLPPRAPTGLAVTSVVRHDANRDDVSLTWLCNNAYTATGFSVERSTDGVNFTQIASLPTTVMTFTDQKAGPGAFYYRVRSFNTQGFSRSSNVVTAEVNVPAAPVNLQVVNLFSQHAEIGWDPNSSSQGGYQIERSSDGVHFTAIATVDQYTTSYIDVRFTAPVYYRVEALNSDGTAGLPSNVLKISYVGQFVSQDIGGVGFPGSATFDNTGAYTVNASGSDIWDVADSFNFVYKPLSGDGEIVARVVSIENPDFWTKAGVMIRGDTSAGAPDAFMLETGPTFNHNEPIFQWRTDANNGTSDSDNHFTPTTPYVPQPMWVRLVRNGSTFYGYYAVDVNNGQDHGAWQDLGGPQTVNMGTNALVGLALTAHNNGTTANAVFDHVTVTQYAPSALQAPTMLTVAHVVKYKTQSSVTLTWRPGSDNESGFKIERSTDGVNFTQVGTAAAGATTFVDTNPDGMGVPNGIYYYRVKAFATGQADSAYSNVDSVRFAQPGSPLTVDHSAGFGSHGDITTSGSTNIFPNPAPVGTFLGHQDVGGVAGPGGATFDNSGTYTVNSASYDIWDVSDSFQYVYKPLTGDGEIDARVVNVGPTDFWAKAGIMMRESLRADSRNAFMLETPNLNGFDHNEPVFQWRSDPGGFTNDSGNHVMHEPAAPIWLRLVRQGNSFTGYWALDVNNGQGHGAWNQLGPTVSLNMPSTLYVGLAVTGQGGNANTSTFDHVTITGTQPPLSPSVLELTDGGFGEASSAFLSNRVGIQNFTTTFNIQITPGTFPMADGMAFVIQGDGASALGLPGGGLGYGSDTLGGQIGLIRSLALKFDLYNNAGEGTDSTGIFTNGRSPTLRAQGLGAGFPDTSIDLSGTGIDLHSGDVFAVTLTYDGNTLTETIRDTVTNASFTTTYTVDIAGLLGSDVGYVGFTGGTGGLTAVQDVLSWTYTATIPKHGQAVTASGPDVTNPTPPTGAYTPGQIRQAYGFDQVAFSLNGTSVVGDGTGQTIAIVDAYNDPNLRNDLDTFDSQFSVTGGSTLLQQYGASSSFLTMVGQDGGTTLPWQTDAGWALETALDVEWAHAIAPGAHILLVEADSGSLDSLLAATDTARNAPGVAVVSMSWGNSEAYLDPAAQAYYDQSLLVTPQGHTGVTFVAAAGDDGGATGPLWPAISPNVLSVGGTTLPADAAGNPNRDAETGWNGSGGGSSLFDVRANPDVAYNADPSTGFAVYDSVPYSGQSGWFQVGGTSAGAPQWSALVAIADQGRQLAGLGTLDGASQTLPALYALAADPASYARDFNDIQTGSNARYSAGPGFDLVTGLGTPNANFLIPDLVQGSGVPQLPSPAPSSMTPSGPSAPAVGAASPNVDPALPAVAPTGAAAFITLPASNTTAYQQAAAPVAPAGVGPGPIASNSAALVAQAPHLLSAPPYVGGESAPAGNDLPDDGEVAWVVAATPQPTMETTVTNLVIAPVRFSEGAPAPWRLACDAYFAEATSPVEWKHHAAALEDPDLGSHAVVNSARGMAALALVLIGSGMAAAEPQPERVPRSRRRW
jgi:hypothetical protein